MTHVLVVEDDSATCHLLTALLRRHGIECTAVNDGITALQALSSASYDAIVLDLLLPHMTGFDVLRQIARAAPEILARVVVHTALPPRMVATCEEIPSVAAVLYKPADVRDITGAILRTAGVAAVYRMPKTATSQL